MKDQVARDWRGRDGLRLAVLLCGLVPLLAGGSGAIGGLPVFGQDPATLSADSHVRYLSGLLLGIGLGFYSTLRRIESHGARFRLLTAIVVLGGLARLLGLVLRGVPDGPMLFGLAMELVVTPLLCLWQARVARAFRSEATQPAGERRGV